MSKNEIRNRLDLMIAAGHPVFVFGGTVALPIEAEDYFQEDEFGEVKAYILSSR